MFSLGGYEYVFKVFKEFMMVNGDDKFGHGKTRNNKAWGRWKKYKE